MKKGGGGRGPSPGTDDQGRCNQGRKPLPNLLKGLPVAPTTKGQVHRTVAVVDYFVYPKQAQNGDWDAVKKDL